MRGVQLRAQLLSQLISPRKTFSSTADSSEVRTLIDNSILMSELISEFPFLIYIRNSAIVHMFHCRLFHRIHYYFIYMLTKFQQQCFPASHRNRQWQLKSLFINHTKLKQFGGSLTLLVGKQIESS